MSSPPPTLIAAFRAAEQPEHLAALMVDDEGDKKRSGFDSDALRVLAAWNQAEHAWTKPHAPQPDDGAPTARAWGWLWSGYRADIQAIARGAGVSPELARDKLEILRHNRLIYPDGSMSRWLLAAMKTHVAKRLTGGKRRSQEDAN